MVGFFLETRRKPSPKKMTHKLLTVIVIIKSNDEYHGKNECNLKLFPQCMLLV